MSRSCVFLFETDHRLEIHKDSVFMHGSAWAPVVFIAILDKTRRRPTDLCCTRTCAKSDKPNLWIVSYESSLGLGVGV